MCLAISNSRLFVLNDKLNLIDIDDDFKFVHTATNPFISDRPLSPYYFRSAVKLSENFLMIEVVKHSPEHPLLAGTYWDLTSGKIENRKTIEKKEEPPTSKKSRRKPKPNQKSPEVPSIGFGYGNRRLGGMTLLKKNMVIGYGLNGGWLYNVVSGKLTNGDMFREEAQIANICGVAGRQVASACYNQYAKPPIHTIQIWDVAERRRKPDQYLRIKAGKLMSFDEFLVSTNGKGVCIFDAKNKYEFIQKIGKKPGNQIQSMKALPGRGIAIAIWK